MTMKAAYIILMSALLAGCGLNEKQIKALDGAMCNVTKGYGVEARTSIVGGASKSNSIHVSGTDCSITTMGTKP